MRVAKYLWALLIGALLLAVILVALAPFWLYALTVNPHAVLQGLAAEWNKFKRAAWESAE